jgi:hypothetical protein
MDEKCCYKDATRICNLACVSYAGETPGQPTVCYELNAKIIRANAFKRISESISSWTVKIIDV